MQPIPEILAMAKEHFVELLSAEAALVNGGNPDLGALYKQNHARGLSNVVGRGNAPIAELLNGHFYAIKGTQKWEQY